MVCFARWVALMIRSQRHEQWAGRTTSKESTAVVVKQPSCSGAGAWIRARLFLLASADGRMPEPYLLPMSYLGALQRPGESLTLRGEQDEVRAMPDLPLRRVA
jgi:hypothetical protein